MVKLAEAVESTRFADATALSMFAATLVMVVVASDAAVAAWVIATEAPDAVNVGANNEVIVGNIGRGASTKALSSVTDLEVATVGVAARDCEAITDNRRVKDDGGEAGFATIPVAVPVGEPRGGKFPINCANVLLRRV